MYDDCERSRDIHQLAAFTIIVKRLHTILVYYMHFVIAINEMFCCC